MAEKKKFLLSAERLVIFSLLIALTFTLAGFAIASAKIPAGNGIVRFCRAKTNGTARIVEPSESCAATEQKVQMRSYDPIGLQYNGLTESIVAGTGRHVAGANRSSAGTYLFGFDRNIDKCIYQATASNTINVVARFNDADSILVFVYDAVASLVDDIVSLTVTC